MTMMSSRQGFPAKTLALQERGQDFKVLDQHSGGKCVVPFAWYNHATSSWRTYQRCFIEGWTRYSGAWPRSGMMQSGIAYPLPTLAPLTKGTGFGLLPTLGANESRGSSRKRFRGSPHFRGAKMSEGLRTCLSDPLYTHPNFAEAAMGFPKDWTR